MSANSEPGTWITPCPKPNLHAIAPPAVRVGDRVLRHHHLADGYRPTSDGIATDHRVYPFHREVDLQAESSTSKTAPTLRRIALDIDTIRESGRGSLSTKEYRRLGQVIDGLRLVAQRLEGTA